MAALVIRDDMSPEALRRRAVREADPRVARRMLAIANALDGMSRADAARAAGMDRQTLRDWVVRYNSHGINGLRDRWEGGRPTTLTSSELLDLEAFVLAGPDQEATGISAYTRDDLVTFCLETFGKRLHKSSIGRILRKIGLSRQKARPQHPLSDPAAQAAFKKSPGDLGIDSVYA